MTDNEARAVPAVEDRERGVMAGIVSDALAASTEGTDWTEAPPYSDEPGSPYVMRITNELLARGAGVSLTGSGLDVDAYLDSIYVMTAEELRRRWPASVERLLRESALSGESGEPKEPRE